MDFQKRLFAYVVLVMSAFMLWNAWQQEHAPKTSPVQSQAQSNTQNIINATNSEQTADNIVPDIPKQQTQSAIANNNNNAHSASTAVDSQQQGKLISVKTNVLDLEINTAGGDLVKSELLDYPLSLKQKDTPFPFLDNQDNQIYQAQSGLIASDGKKLTPVYSSPQSSYVLTNNQKQLVVKLNWTSPNGLNITKNYIFYPDSYKIDVNYQITNNSSQTWSGHSYSQLVRTGTPPESAGDSHYTYFGAAISTPDEHYDKIKFSSMLKEPVSQNVTGGWVAMIQHYFVSAWVPNKDSQEHFYSKASKSSDLYTIGSLSPNISVAPGQTVNTSNMVLYSGPAIAENLEAVAPNLRLTIDYGWLWFISNIIFWLMQKIYSFVGNWGWSIVLVTVVIKAIFYQLSAKSYKSMAAMKRLQPKIAILKDRFGSDKQQLSKATMELYRKEKVNPLGGCLPILVQIPVFIALYWVIVESVQLRQAPFIFWIHDLSIKDPFYVLPVIMGITMFVQQKISPPPPDPVQAKVMLLLPVVFTVFFLQFPAGLVLYWIVNNSISITQQWFMMRKYGDMKNFRKIEKEKKNKEKEKNKRK